jgi:hypothetical protein
MPQVEGDGEVAKKKKKKKGGKSAKSSQARLKGANL